MEDPFATLPKWLFPMPACLIAREIGYTRQLLATGPGRLGPAFGATPASWLQQETGGTVTY